MSSKRKEFLPQRILFLPLFPAKSESDVRDVAKTVAEILEEHRRD